MKYMLQRNLLNGIGKYILLATFSLALYIPAFAQEVPAPELLSPTDTEENVPVSPTLNWEEVIEADYYEVQVATNTGFADPQIVDGDNDITETSYIPEELEYETIYYWRVRGYTDENPDSEEWSDVWSFTTEPDPRPAQPDLVSPANGIDDQPLEVDLIWDSAERAETYEVQVTSNNDFENPDIADSPVVAGLTYQLTGLENDTEYSWRVRGVNNDGEEGPWSDIWAFRTEEELLAPDIPELLEPGSGESGVSITPTLIWEEVNEADNYDVEINDEDEFGEGEDLIDSATGLSVTNYQPNNIEYGGNYYWRVQATNDAGPSGFSDSFNFTVEDEPLNPPETPTLDSPADGVDDQPLDVELSWNSTDGAQTYQIQIATDSGFSDIVEDDDGFTDTTYEPDNLDYNTEYYWRVQAHNEDGPSGWSTSRSFTTEDEPLQEPDAPSLSSPNNNASGVSISPTLEWEEVAEADSYELVVSTNSDFSSPIVDVSDLTDTSFDLEDLDYETTYHWRVRAVNEAGESEWSSRSFTTEEEPLQAPEAPQLTSPDNNASDVSINPTLEWEEADETDYYELQVSTNSNFTSTVVDETDISGTSFDLEDLDYETTYHWRVRSVNAAGPSEEWASRSFTTEDEPLQAPEAPSLNSPDDGASDISVDLVELDWGESAGADTYELQVSTNSDFSSPIVEESDLTDTSFDLEDLDYETTYHWRVRAVNEAGESGWSSRSFTTEEEPLQAPEAPQLTSPDNNASGVTINPTLEWEEVDETDSYELQVSTNSNFTGPVVDETGISGTSFDLEDLDYETTYHWRVRARNEAGAGDWSSRNFTTEVIPAPATPELDSPEEGETVSITPELSWDTAARAATYQVQIATTPGFSSNSIVQNESGISGTSYDADPLSYETIYYWRVRASNNGGTSDWAEVRSFRTQDEPLQPPATPSLVSPANEATGISINPVLEWGSAADASSYELQVAEDSGFNSLVFEEDGISGLSRTVTEDLDYLTVYYWRVRAVNQAGESDWSGSRSFTTAELILPDAPENLVLETISGGIRLTWDEIEDDDIEEYVIYRGGSTDDLSAVAKVFAGTTTFETSVSSTQYFGVSAINDSGNEGPLSNIVSFIDTSADIHEEWQLFSSPLDIELELNSSLQLFSFDKSYRVDNTILPLNGYWVKSSDVNQINFNGPGIDSGSIELAAGWNLIGALSDVIDVSSIEDPDEILTSTPVWGYDPESFNYVEADRLSPARGYWIYASESGTIELQLEIPEEPDGHGDIDILNSIAQARMNRDEKDHVYEQLTFTSSGAEQHFLFSANSLTEEQQQAHLLPPKAPAPLLDVRTQENYRIGSGHSVALSITADSYPVTVQVDELHDSKMAYRLELHDGRNQVHLPLKPGSIQTIDRQYDSVYLSRVNEEELATDFKLNQNYPNPFNPATTIQYRVAQQSNVTLVVYNILGREVMTLVNETKQPGIYTARFDGSGLSSGVYMVRMVAGDFVSIQKMTLLK